MRALGMATAAFALSGVLVGFVAPANAAQSASDGVRSTMVEFEGDGRDSLALPSASGNDPRRVPFRPWTGSFPTGVGRDWTLRRHTLVVVPTYAILTPDVSAVTALARQAISFWTRQIPGLKITLKVTKPVALPRDVLCDKNRAIRVSSLVPGLPRPWRYLHVANVALECPSAGLGSDGIAAAIYAGGEYPDVLAHEFGHNLTLKHANRVTCTAAGKPVTLSRTCVEVEYADGLDVMGGGRFPLPEDLVGTTFSGVAPPTFAQDAQLSGVAQAVLTGRVARVPDTGATVTVHAAGRVDRTAQVQTAFGPVFFTPSPALPAADLPVGVRVHVATREGSGLLSPPAFDGSVSEDHMVMEPGDTWSIDGSTLAVTVVSASDDAARLTFIPKTRRGAPPGSPVITAASAVVPGQPFVLEWAPSEGAANYVVMSNGAIVGRTSGNSLTVEELSLPARMVVWAVSPTGLRSASAETVLPGDPPG